MGFFSELGRAISAPTKNSGRTGGLFGGIIGGVIGVVGRIGDNIAPMGFGLEDEGSAEEASRRNVTRAILAEAALQAVSKLDQTNPDYKTFFGAMEKYYTESAGSTDSLARTIASAAPQVQSSINVSDASTQTTAATTTYPNVPEPLNDLNAEQEAFAKRLMAAAESSTDYQTTGFGDFFGPIIRNALVIPPLGLSLAEGAGLMSNSAEPEAEPVDSNAEDAAKRALLGDAALQAIADDDGAVTTMGFFNDMIRTVGKIGGTIINNSGNISKAIGVVVGTS